MGDLEDIKTQSLINPEPKIAIFNSNNTNNNNNISNNNNNNNINNDSIEFDSNNTNNNNNIINNNNNNNSKSLILSLPKVSNEFSYNYENNSNFDNNSNNNDSKSLNLSLLYENNSNFDNNTNNNTNNDNDSIEYDSIIDISSKSLNLSNDFTPKKFEQAKGLYIYKNNYNLIPNWLGEIKKLKTLKYFGNEVNIFPNEMKNLVELERLQVKVSSPKLSGLCLNNMKHLKELELSKVPFRPSVFPLLSEIAGLKSLTKLSVCHFSIRYLPPEIGFLENLEFLDLSFNKMRSLPNEILSLTSLKSLKVTNNKLVDLPLGFSSLKKLELLDLSNNRLSSFDYLELSLMHNLQTLNLQNNKLVIYRQLPSWICCNLEGNDEDDCIDECTSVVVEMDVLEDDVQDNVGRVSQKGIHTPLSSHPIGVSSTSRGFAARKSRKGWRRRYDIQQRARQERLNNSRKGKISELAKSGKQTTIEKLKACEDIAVDSDLTAPDNNGDDSVSEQSRCEAISVDDDDKTIVEKIEHVENGSCSNIKSTSIQEGENNCGECQTSPVASQVQALCDNSSNSKRPHDEEVDEQPNKRRLISDQSDLAFKYCETSFCSIDDHLGDGFYDAGRSRPFLPLENYEKSLHLDSREVILLDRRKDEGLNVIAHCAQALVNHFRQINDSLDKLQIASLLALFVSDHFGGRDKSALIERTNREASGSNYRKPFICTCPTGNSDSARNSPGQSSGPVGDIVMLDLCEKSLQTVKERISSVIVPIGTVQFGVCRHRALLMKYLCDRVKPHVPCELVRGYLDFSPHAWNVVVFPRGDSLVRMIVDACHPYEMREETDPEYFCRYVPLSRIYVPHVTGNGLPLISFPSLSACDEIEKEGCSTLVRCDVGSIEAVAKVRALEAGCPMEEVRNFEYVCLGEVRILNAVKNHPCIVEIYGHKISSKWVKSSDGEPRHRILQSAILMEYIKGGSLKKYIEELLRNGKKHVRGKLALHIAKDVASALLELHSKHIIHRDIKSGNILIDLDDMKPDGTPIVKLCDFDSAVPLRSWLHSCCIAHNGILPPNVCIGTPRWMAPEVYRARHAPALYGLEVDIWSFGCLLYEMLTLQVPYSDLSESEINELLHKGERPQLPKDLEELIASDKSTSVQSSKESAHSEAETEAIKFLVDIYCRCMKNNPADRPSAELLYELLVERASSINETKKSEEA